VKLKPLANFSLAERISVPAWVPEGPCHCLKKAGCERVKAVNQLEFSVSADDIKEPLAEAIALGGKFYSEVWANGGRQIADEAIRQIEEETHRASEEAKRAEEVAERERRIGIRFC
jgi:hypothetical protein